MSAVQDHVQRTVAYFEQDLVSYESVANNGELKGKLGVGMITNATAALNLFAWLLYQTLDQKINDRDLFKKLITDDRFFTVTDFINEKVLYGIVRCGVVHQFYPKNISIISAPRKDDVFVRDNDELAGVNAIAFYRKTLEGLKKARDYILGLSPGKELDRLDFKLELRRRLDEAELEGAELDIKSLPLVPWRRRL